MTDPVLVSAPASEPVSVSEAKAHLRVDISDDDSYIGALITAARLHVEARLGAALITQTWKVFADAFESEIKLPRWPLQSVTHVKTYDLAEAAATVSSAIYFVDSASVPGRISLKYGKTWPDTVLRPRSGVEIQFVAGYGAAPAVPQPIKHALLLLIGHWYENREAVVVGNTAATVSKRLDLAVDALLQPYQVYL